MPPTRTTAPANPAETCTSIGRTALSHFRLKLSSQLDFRAGLLVRDGETKLQAKIGRSLCRAKRSQRLLHGAQSGELVGAGVAGLKMLGDLLHLLAADGAVEVGGEGRPASSGRS